MSRLSISSSFLVYCHLRYSLDGNLVNYLNLGETVVRCAAGTSEPFAVEVGLHQGSAFSPFLFAIMMDSLMENIRKYAPWQMIFADDVVLCAMEKELEHWRREG